MRDSKPLNATRKKILQSTLDLVAEGDFSSLTVRAIADRAGVNVAAVNYHFGSKARAVAEAFAFVAVDFAKAFEPLRGAEPPRERLAEFALALARAVVAHGRAIAFFVSRLDSGLPAPPGYRAFVDEEGFALVLRSFLELDPAATKAEVAMRLSVLSGALLYPELVRGAYGFDYGREEARARYARFVLAAFLAPAQTDSTLPKEATCP